MLRTKSISKEAIIKWTLLGAASVLAGLLAQSMHIPGGWLVGPMLVAVASALSWQKHPSLPIWARQASLAVVGSLLAATYRPSVVPLIVDAWFPVSLVVAGTLLLSLAAGSLIARFSHLDLKTTALGTLPGAASGMLAMSGPLGAEPPVVGLMQYTRVVVVVSSAAVVSRLWFTSPVGGLEPPTQALQATLPQVDAVFDGVYITYALTVLVAAFGAWAGTRLRLPAGGLLGPLIFGIALEQLGILHLTWPPGVPQLAYLGLGLYVGLLFDRASVLRVAPLLPFILLSTVLLILGCAGLGWALASLTPVNGITAYLATTPGGIDSVAIMALGTGADAPLVLAIQMLRLFTVVGVGAILARWWA